LDSLKEQSVNGVMMNMEGGNTVQMEELRAERDMIKDDLEQSQLMIYNLKADMQDLESQLATEQRGWLEQRRSLQEQCQMFQATSSQHREQLEQLKLEYQYIQDELRRHEAAVDSKLQEKDAEIARLMNQSRLRTLNGAANGSSDMEQRVRNLTESLIQKQTVIETLETDRRALTLQLERVERLYREAESAAIRSSSSFVIDMGSDGTTLTSRGVPSFLEESPSDTGVTRGVKKVYGTLNGVSVRLGLVLRRYPTTRVFLFLYCLLLHVWVFFILFTYTPETHPL